MTIRRAESRLGDQVVRALRDAISAGRLAPGTRLPSSRDLAGDLGVSRGLVVAAYEQLSAEGLLTARRGTGTAVAAAPSPTALPAAVAVPTAPAVVAPLRPGTPDPGLFPRAAWRRAYQEALAALPDGGLGYGDPAGLPLLRSSLAGYLGRVRSASADAQSIIVTTGASQALTLLATALRQSGETAIGVEDPGSEAIRAHLTSHGLTPVAIPVDRDGLIVDVLADTDVRSVVVTPAHQFPLGHVLAPTRRSDLVAWARRVDGLVIEDDYDAEFRYDREPVGTVQFLGPDVVALVGTVSKALAPALRLGWVSPPAPWRDRITALKFAADGGGPALEHAAFARFLDGGAYDRHLRRSRRVYRERRDATVAALREHLPEGEISGVAAGMHLVIELQDIDDGEIAARAADAGLGPLPLSAARIGGAGIPGLLIGYGSHSPTTLRDAVRRLAAIVHGHRAR